MRSGLMPKRRLNRVYVFVCLVCGEAGLLSMTTTHHSARVKTTKACPCRYIAYLGGENCCKGACPKGKEWTDYTDICTLTPARFKSLTPCKRNPCPSPHALVPYAWSSAPATSSPTARKVFHGGSASSAGWAESQLLSDSPATTKAPSSPPSVPPSVKHTDPSWCTDLLKKECHTYFDKGVQCEICAHSKPEIDSNCVWGSVHSYCYYFGGHSGKSAKLPLPAPTFSPTIAPPTPAPTTLPPPTEAPTSPTEAPTTPVAVGAAERERLNVYQSKTQQAGEEQAQAVLKASQTARYARHYQQIAAERELQQEEATALRRGRHGECKSCRAKGRAWCKSMGVCVADEPGRCDNPDPYDQIGAGGATADCAVGLAADDSIYGGVPGHSGLNGPTLAGSQGQENQRPTDAPRKNVGGGGASESGGAGGGSKSRVDGGGGMVRHDVVRSSGGASSGGGSSGDHSGGSTPTQSNAVWRQRVAQLKRMPPALQHMMARFLPPQIRHGFETSAACQRHLRKYCKATFVMAPTARWVCV
jgi:hypothetical protein